MWLARPVLLQIPSNAFDDQEKACTEKACTRRSTSSGNPRDKVAPPIQLRTKPQNPQIPQTPKAVRPSPSSGGPPPSPPPGRLNRSCRLEARRHEAMQATPGGSPHPLHPLIPPIPSWASHHPPPLHPSPALLAMSPRLVREFSRNARASQPFPRRESTLYTGSMTPHVRKTPIARRLCRKAALVVVLVSTSLSASGCLLTKIVTVPMRVGAAVISIVPIAGNSAHDSIDTVAETIDDVPI